MRDPPPQTSPKESSAHKDSDFVVLNLAVCRRRQCHAVGGEAHFQKRPHHTLRVLLCGFGVKGNLTDLRYRQSAKLPRDQIWPMGRGRVRG